MSKEKDPKEAGCLLLWSYREGRRKTSTENVFLQNCVDYIEIILGYIEIILGYSEIILDYIEKARTIKLEISIKNRNIC